MELLFRISVKCRAFEVLKKFPYYSQSIGERIFWLFYFSEQVTQISVDRLIRQAKRHEKAGDVAEARAAYQAILAKFPSNERAAAALQALGAAAAAPGVDQLVALSREGRHDLVLQNAAALAAQFPHSIDIHNLLGVAAANLGRHQEAVAAFQTVIEIDPNFAEAHWNLGNAYSALGDAEKTISCYQKALTFWPDRAVPHLNFGNFLQSLGRWKEASEAYAKAIKLKPDFAAAYYNQANSLTKIGRDEDALPRYQKAIEIQPDFADAHTNLAGALRRMNRKREALAHYERSLELQPNSLGALNNLGDMLVDLGRNEDAIEILERALKKDQEFSATHNNLGNALKQLGHYEEAIVHYEKAVELDPACAQAYNNMGAIYVDLGRKRESKTYFEKAISIAPAYASAHRNLSASKRYEAGDPQVEEMATLLRGVLSGDDRAQLHYALGKAYEDLSAHGDAFTHYLEGNRLRKAALGYDIAQDRALFAEITSVFAEADEVVGAVGDDTPVPIFIVGLPRSGTSLTEQILASHSRAHGGGELSLLDTAVRNAGGLRVAAAPEGAEKIGVHYRRELAKLSDGAGFVTDKLPLNFRWVGFIRRALPDAKIIHMVRDPRATSWSCFKHYFSTDGNGHVYDLSDLGEYYNLYKELMAFWSSRYPGTIYDLNYERLTENHEDETRRLLEYIGLEWEDACLDFHQTERAVVTASSMQVREKIYQGSSEEWRKYEPFLAPLLDKLNL